MRAFLSKILTVLAVFFNPKAGVYKSFDPRTNLVPAAVRVSGPVPLKHRALNVRHRYKMASGFVAHHGYVVVGTVRVGRIFFVSVLCYDIVPAFFVRKLNRSFAVRNPYP